MPITLRGPRKAVRGKCERGRSGCGSHSAEGRILRGRHRRPCGGSVNAGAEVQTQTGRVRKPSRAMGTRRGRLSAPWPRFHGVDRADVYIIIHVRACCCGECALNPPPSPPILRRRLPLAPAQRHALPEHFRSPTQPRRTPAGCAMHSPPTSQPIPRRRPSPPTYSDTPSRALPLPHAAPTHTRRLRDAFLAHLTTHSRRRPSPAHAQRHAPPPFRFGHKKNGTAQRVCDAECLGRPSLRSVIGVGEPRAVRRRCGALAWRVGLRPQPWALRSRRCGRVLRA